MSLGIGIGIATNEENFIPAWLAKFHKARWLVIGQKSYISDESTNWVRVISTCDKQIRWRHLLLMYALLTRVGYYLLLSDDA